MKIIKNLMFTVALMFGSVANANIMVWLDPATADIGGVGDDISLKVMISGLGDHSPSSLGGFDLNVLFDADVLSFTGYALFNELGDIGAFEADDFSNGEYSPGAINLTEVSYLYDYELDSLQPDMFALAELFFHVDAITTGQTTLISLIGRDFADSTGFGSLTVDVIQEALINAVPTPASFSLISLALFAMFSRSRKLTNIFTKPTN